MIHADLDKILPEEDALKQITTIFNEVEKLRELYVITKSGRPAAAVINIDYLEELTGQEVKQNIAGDVDEEQTDQPTTEKVESELASEIKPTATPEFETSTVSPPPSEVGPAVTEEIEVDEGQLITEEEANKIPTPPTPSPQVEPQSPPATPQTTSTLQATTAEPPVTSLNLPPEQTPADSPTPPPTVPPLADNDLDSSANNPANSSPLI